MCDHGTSGLLPFRTTVFLRAQGRWGGGGVVEIEHDGRSRSLLLAPALFDLLGILMVKARQRVGDEASPIATFLNSGPLCTELRRRTRGTPNPLDPDPPNLARYVCRLRQALNIPNLVEHQRHLGYRLSTAPENLSLLLLSETPEDAT